MTFAHYDTVARLYRNVAAFRFHRWAPTSGPTRKALGLLLAAIAIALFLSNLRRAGERAGRLAERLSTSERNDTIHRQMLDAAARCPLDRNALADRLRDGRF